ncbi:MAG: helix-turn-helix domain-containing protein [Clostridia bacterium]|nr:helix-turn-helix domain-containing protein [Clostridia bacterium]
MNIRLSNFYSIDFLCDAYQNGPRLAYFKANFNANSHVDGIETTSYETSKNDLKRNPAPVLSSCVEYTLIKNGTAVFSVGDKKFRVEKGDFIFLHPEETSLLEASDDLSFLSVGVLSVDFTYEKSPSFACEELYPDLLFFFEAIERELKTQSGGYKKMLRSLFSCLHILLKRRAADEPRKLQEKKPAKAVLNAALPAKKFIDAHFAQELDLKFLSGICGITQQHLIKQFKLLTGHSPHQYLNRVRVLAAANILVSKTENIRDVSEKVGFQEPHSFLYTFKKLLGVTPVEFRKKYESDPIAGLTQAKFTVMKKKAEQDADEQPDQEF